MQWATPSASSPASSFSLDRRTFVIYPPVTFIVLGIAVGSLKYKMAQHIQTVKLVEHLNSYHTLTRHSPDLCGLDPQLAGFFR